MGRNEQVSYSRESDIPFDLGNILGNATGMMHNECTITDSDGNKYTGYGNSRDEAYRNAQAKQED